MQATRSTSRNNARNQLHEDDKISSRTGTGGPVVQKRVAQDDFADAWYTNTVSAERCT